MATANEAWLDALVRHQVGLMRLAPAISDKVNRLLNDSEADIKAQILARAERGMSTVRLDGLLKSIKLVRQKAWGRVRKEWATRLLEIAKWEPEFLDETLKAVVPSTLDVTLPTAAALGSMVQATPFEGRVMSDWASRVEAQDLARIEQQIKIGLHQGQSSRDIASRIVGTVQMRGMDGVTQITRNNANAITRTAVNAISNAAKQAFYAENEHLFDQEVFMAVLDARTTIRCASLDNKKFKLGQGPVPPLHWNCRSLRLAIINDEVIGNRPAREFTKQQLLREYSQKEGFRAPKERDGLPSGHKGSYDRYARKRMRELTGQVPAHTSYQDWLMRQSKAFQDDVLGPKRGELFRSGKFTLDKFVNRNGDKLTIEQLMKLDRTELPRATPPN
jgi:SPP1 gp7 family putative phage head morphogenesis protein